MTKSRICVKINIMNMQTRKNFINYVILFLFLVLTVCCTGFYQSMRSSSADSKQTTSTTFLPQTSLENFDLTSPIDVYHDQSVTAIADDTQKLFINYNGTWYDGLTDFTAIKQVKKLNETNLLVSNQGIIYNIDLSKLDNSPLTVKTSLNDQSSNPIGGNFFDINDKYLVTAFGTTCLIYEKTENGFNLSSSFPVKEDSPIAINDNNQIFFVDSQNKIIVRDVSDSINKKILCEGVAPSKIIADNNFVYYIKDNNIFRISTFGGEPTLLNDSGVDIKFELGNINAPIAISFKDENLLITEQNTIQEFEIKDNELVFTGFAIAKGKTAYNRVSKNSTAIDKTNKNIAVLDDFKFTVFTNDNSQNRYARENYKNYFLSQLKINNISPSTFALGKQNALLLYNAKSSDSFVALLDFTKDENFLSEQSPINDNRVIRDLCYQSGYYYLLCDNGSAPQHIYRAEANAQNFEFVKIDSNTSNTEFTMFAVDTYSNIYLANSTTIKKLSSDDEYKNLVDVKSGFTNITKIRTDLLGRLYVLDENAIKSAENNEELLTNVKSFAFDFVNDDAFLLYNDSEFISITTEFDNISIADLVVPNDFNLSFNPQDPNTASNNLKFFKAKEGANAYVVKPNSQSFSAGDKFMFDKLNDYTGEYVLICTVMCNNTPQFYALANQDSIALIDINQAEPIDNQPILVDKTVYVATDTNCYYLPIITSKAEFALTSDSSKIRLEKATTINAKKQISFLGCDYYYAEFSINNTNYAGYIPCDFTVDVLTDDFAWDEFSLEKVNKTSVYSKSDMQEKVFELAKNDTVRILEKGDKICKIAYKNGDVWKVGYIYTSQIINQPKIAIRNILIILAVAGCVCGTCTYFLLRSKKKSGE